MRREPECHTLAIETEATMAAKKKKAKRSATAKKRKTVSARKPVAKAKAKRVTARKAAPKKAAPKKAAPKKMAAPKKHAAPKQAAPKPAKKVTPVFEVATIVQEELFDAAPMDIYEAIVDPSKHAAFTGSVATGEPIEGGSFTAWDGYIEGRHERLVPGARIVQIWRASDFPEDHPASRLELELRPEPEGKTRLRMTHSGVPRARAKEYEQGWLDNYWNPLREYLRDEAWTE
ncbi:MAG TPA: SRPBCC domain-containing protein [Polyangiaceae bacterium]|nr:SRPBCC domain-containing protein [Polyangiaceae bacterium]